MALFLLGRELEAAVYKYKFTVGVLQTSKATANKTFMVPDLLFSRGTIATAY